MATADKKEYYRLWRLRNADKIKSYAINNRVKSKIRLKTWRYANPARTLYLNIKSRAKQREIEFNLDWQDINIPTICPALGIPIITGPNEGSAKGPSPNSPSVDRIDNTKGYIKGNIMVISHKANSMKNSATPRQLMRFAKWITNMYEETYEQDGEE